MTEPMRSNEDIRAFTRIVWEREPDDIKRLRETGLPPGGRWSGVFFCDVLLLWSAQTLMTLRGLARADQVPAKALATVAAAHLNQLADWLAHWRMDDTVALLRPVARRFEAGEPWTGTQLCATIEELVVALNRTQNWIDAFVPWSRLDASLPKLDRVTAPGRVER